MFKVAVSFKMHFKQTYVQPLNSCQHAPQFYIGPALAFPPSYNIKGIIRKSQKVSPPAKSKHLLCIGYIWPCSLGCRGRFRGNVSIMDNYTYWTLYNILFPLELRLSACLPGYSRRPLGDDYPVHQYTSITSNAKKSLLAPIKRIVHIKNDTR